MEDHGVLDGEAAPGSKDPLIVRGAVLAGVGDAALLHSLLGLLHIPALGLGAGEGDAVQCIQMDEEVHHRGGDEVDVVQRLAERDNIGGQVIHLCRVLGDHEESAAVRDVHQHISPLIAVGGELSRVVQRIAAVEHERGRIGRGGLCLSAASEGKCGGGQGFQKIAALHRL